jgi:hypothetical protein
MSVSDLLQDKTLKTKQKTELLSQWLLDHTVSPGALIELAQKAKDPIKATCIEALEFATKQTPSLATEAVLDFVAASLTEKAPRVKWESAKVIGNIAHLFPDRLETAIGNLLTNSEHEGTVVRWSAAFALGEIIQIKTPLNAELLPAAQAICEREEKNSIRKIYLTAIKKAQKQ